MSVLLTGDVENDARWTIEGEARRKKENSKADDFVLLVIKKAPSWFVARLSYLYMKIDALSYIFWGNEEKRKHCDYKIIGQFRSFVEIFFLENLNWSF